MIKLINAALAVVALLCASPAFAKPAAKPTPKAVAPALPDRVEEVDYQRMQALIAKAQAAEANLRAAQLADVVAQTELDKARAAFAAGLADANARYKMAADGDHVEDAPPHKIVRGAK